MNVRKAMAMAAFLMALVMMPVLSEVYAIDKSPYMGGDVNLTKAPNGAIIREEMISTAAKIFYLEPTTEKLAEGVWCIGGYSLANTTVIEAEGGLIVYDTGDTKEEAEHIRCSPRPPITGKQRNGPYHLIPPYLS
jgi:hypothetical protein